MSDLNKKYKKEYREKSDPNILSDLNKKYINKYKKRSGKQYICENRDRVEKFRKTLDLESKEEYKKNNKEQKSKKRKIIQEFEENNVDSIVISYKKM